MSRATVFSLFLVVGIGGLANGGLIVQPSSGTTIAPGATADFDLIIRNETPAQTWSGINGLAPFKLDDPIPLLAGQTAPSFNPAIIRGVSPEPLWDQSQFNLGSGEWFFLIANSKVPNSLTLLPGEEFKFATLSIDIPVDFMGSFQLQLANTTSPLTLLAGGVDPTLGGSPLEPWFEDPNPPLPFTPAPPGGGAPTGFAAVIQVTAVPEPGPVSLLSFVGAFVCGISVWRKRHF